jgi:type IV secretory pathway TraG/TraD family ATPase VirD4
MGGRLDPPMLPILDEACNIVRLEDLPDLYSYLGGTGIPAVTIMQSYRQGAKAWGEIGMDALWGAATIKLVGAGIDDPDFAGKLSRLIGDYPIWRRSVSFGGSSGHSNSVQPHDRPSMQASEIRTLGKGRALLLATGIPIAKIRLRPWYESDDANALSAQEKQAKSALRERAEAAYKASLTEYDESAGVAA